MGKLKIERTVSFRMWMTTILGLVILSSLREINGLEIKARCSDDYSPCSCTQDGVDVFVTCVNVQPAQIKEAFSRTSYPVLKEVEIVLPADAGALPADILSRKVAEIVKLRGSGRDSFLMTSDIGAFTPSRNKAKLFEISDADLSQLNFSFLDGFAYLENFYLSRISGIRVIKDVRLLQNLDAMFINDCVGFTDFSEFPLGSFPNLRVLHLTNNYDLYDDKLSIILTALDASSARDYLLEIVMDTNRLTQVPLRLSNFPNMQRVSIRSNHIDALQVNSIKSVNLTHLNIQNNSLSLIEPGAFVGDFSASEIYLDLNNLTVLHENVYKDLLQSMFDAGQGGLVSIDKNPILCDCSIAWLIARNQHLLQNIGHQARCSDGRLLSTLHPNDYEEPTCP